MMKTIDDIANSYNIMDLSGANRFKEELKQKAIEWLKIDFDIKRCLELGTIKDIIEMINHPSPTSAYMRLWMERFGLTESDILG